MSGPSWVHGDPSVRAVLKQCSCTTGVIEVHMGQQNPVHGLRTETERRERPKNSGHRILGRGVNHRNATLFNDKMDRIELVTKIARIKRIDALTKVAHQGGDQRGTGVLVKRGRESHGVSNASC
jgi:hypothetical protein